MPDPNITKKSGIQGEEVNCGLEEEVSRLRTRIENYKTAMAKQGTPDLFAHSIGCKVYLYSSYTANRSSRRSVVIPILTISIINEKKVLKNTILYTYIELLALPNGGMKTTYFLSLQNRTAKSYCTRDKSYPK